ncbi:DNA polymerase III subunit gamma/tau [Cystobacter fuscus]|uniref:DNA polymerase III subunit gamma/tau n=1 Tax=Cystobacter fuscus TaxID=43 RepID=UPI002B2ABF68|nr:DNA polymerase III subunit gamma/tau [Cystobacter fuscus]
MPPASPVPAQPVVRVTNVRPPPRAPVAAPEPPPVDDERYFPEEGPADGCASGECLPEEPPPPEPESVRPFDVHHARPAGAAAAPMMTASGRDNPRRPLQDRWRAAVDTMRQASGRHAKSLACGRLLWIREGEVAIAYPPKDGFHKATVSGSGRAIVEKALAEHFGRPTKLVVQDCAEGDKAAEGAVGPETGTGLISLAEQDASERAAYEKSTEGRVRAHPAVRATLKLLGGEIEHIQVYDLPVRPVAAPTSESPDESP